MSLGECFFCHFFVYLNKPIFPDLKINFVFCPCLLYKFTPWHHFWPLYVVCRHKWFTRIIDPSLVVCCLLMYTFHLFVVSCRDHQDHTASPVDRVLQGWRYKATHPHLPSDQLLSALLCVPVILIILSPDMHTNAHKHTDLSELKRSPAGSRRSLIWFSKECFCIVKGAVNQNQVICALSSL